MTVTVVCCAIPPDCGTCRGWGTIPNPENGRGLVTCPDCGGGK